ncbi:type I DNA topoisomerase [Candidatus Roizmanbacteria bacterium]|nr:type I DNA topoisomerase [Candidatus Roizmanbacteria bacterium]
MALIIVESPTKARTFNRILKDQDFFVYATMGHIRDLPGKTMSIDYTHQFKPDYEIMKNKEKVVAKLRELVKEHDQIYLATDPDREGESISYHVAYILGFIKEEWPDFNLLGDGKLKRIVFHEITAHALQEALEHPATLRTELVKAQQARRILDRIVGYELSPLLWKKMGKNWLSAGRVQTVALRLVVEREKEIRAFSLEPYCQLYGNFIAGEPLRAKLIKLQDEPVEQSFKLSLFAGEYTYTKTIISPEKALEIQKEEVSDTFEITNVREDISSRFPPPPYTTSLLQQDAFIRHGFSSKMTMRLAQDLYERGLITYHRTDSFNLSTQFVFKAKDYIKTAYGEEYALEKPRGYKTKSKMAQEAHEAIRPTKLEQNVDKLEKLNLNQKRLYDLIFNRAVATQMKEASIKTTKVEITSKKQYTYESEYQQVLFDGFLRVAQPDFAAKHSAAVSFKVGDPVSLSEFEIQELSTKAPPRYNEASLIKILEEKGIGRPSTYAPIISLVQEKNYIEKQNRYFSPTKLGESISEYLSQSFPQLFNLDFTAQMEESMDLIAEGKNNIVAFLTDFYKPFQEELIVQKKDTKVIDVEEEVSEPCDKCGAPLVVRFSRFGKFYACSKYPECKNTKPFLQFVNNYTCPKCGGKIAVRYSKSKKRFYGCEKWPKCDFSAWALKDAKAPEKKQTRNVVEVKPKTKKKVTKKNVKEDRSQE